MFEKPCEIQQNIYMSLIENMYTYCKTYIYQYKQVGTYLKFE